MLNKSLKHQTDYANGHMQTTFIPLITSHSQFKCSLIDGGALAATVNRVKVYR